MRPRPFAALLVSVLVALGGVLATGGIASGAPEGYTIQEDEAGDRLVGIDLATGAETPASAALTDITGVQDLAFGGGTLYGVSVDNDLLIRINRSDGSLEGSVGLSVAVSAAGITFTADGTLWMTATVPNGVRLFRVEPATGEATEVGLLGTPGAPDITGLATTCDDEIVGVADATQVVQIQTDPPKVEPFLGAFASGPESLALDPATGIVWGIRSGGKDPGLVSQVDPVSGFLTDTVATTISGQVAGLAIGELPCAQEVVAPAPAAVPEPLQLVPTFTG